VNGEDILFAMTSLGFENYAEALKIYLAKYREVSNAFPACLLRRAYSPEHHPCSGSVLCTEVLTSLLRLNRHEEIISHALAVGTGLHPKEVGAVGAVPAPLVNLHLLELIIHQPRASITY